MELDVFVQKTIEQIVDGVKAARDSKGITVVDPFPTGAVTPDVQHRYANVFKYIEFDVAVTAKENSAADVGAKISVLGASLGSNLTTDSASSTVTRVKFSVPVLYSGGR